MISKEINKRLSEKWNTMRQRCYDKNSAGYKYYGAKGITMCNEWLTNKSKFIKWAVSNEYSDGLVIHRIDSAKGYFPENCQFVSRNENMKRRGRSEPTEASKMLMEKFNQMFKKNPKSMASYARAIGITQPTFKKWYRGESIQWHIEQIIANYIEKNQ